MSSQLENRKRSLENIHCKPVLLENEIPSQENSIICKKQKTYQESTSSTTQVDHEVNQVSQADNEVNHEATQVSQGDHEATQATQGSQGGHKVDQVTSLSFSIHDEDDEVVIIANPIKNI
jgi:hypothetical protein